MITVSAKVHRILRDVGPHGTVSYTAQVSLDESPDRVTVRLTADEYAALEAALVKDSRFTVALRPAAPTIEDLAAREVTS